MLKVGSNTGKGAKEYEIMEREENMESLQEHIWELSSYLLSRLYIFLRKELCPDLLLSQSSHLALPFDDLSSSTHHSRFTWRKSKMKMPLVPAASVRSGSQQTLQAKEGDSDNLPETHHGQGSSRASHREAGQTQGEASQ